MAPLVALLPIWLCRAGFHEATHGAPRHVGSMVEKETLRTAVKQAVVEVQASGAPLQRQQAACGRPGALVERRAGCEPWQEGGPLCEKPSTPCLEIGNTCTGGKAPIISPLVFGPIVWAGLHNVAARYPQHLGAFEGRKGKNARGHEKLYQANPSTRTAARDFIEAIPFLLPCGHCGAHFWGYITNNCTASAGCPDRKSRGGPIDVWEATRTQNTLVKFFVDSHVFVTWKVNLVKDELGELSRQKPMWRRNTLGYKQAQREHTCKGTCASDTRFWDMLHVMGAGYHTPAGDSADGLANEVLQARAIKFLNSLPYMIPCGSCGVQLKAFFDARDLTRDVMSKASFIDLLVSAQNNVTRYVNETGIWNDDHGIPKMELLSVSDLHRKFTDAGGHWCMDTCVTDGRVWEEHDEELWAQIDTAIRSGNVTAFLPTDDTAIGDHSGEPNPMDRVHTRRRRDQFPNDQWKGSHRRRGKNGYGQWR